jgi:Ca2+-binding RTX toxin-like protein
MGRLLPSGRAGFGAVAAGVLIAVAAAPGGAGASAVRVLRTQGSNGRGTDITKTMTYVADPGEANALDVAAAGASPAPAGAVRRYRLTDPGATIRPGPGCRAESAHAVVCEIADEELGDYDSLTDAVSARLGDRGDTARSRPDIDSSFAGGAGDDRLGVDLGFATLRGGPGSDLLTAGPRTDVLDGGGGGHDELHGGDSYDVLSDGDTSAAADDDVLDGGPNPEPGGSFLIDPLGGAANIGGDVVSYTGRTRGVSVDLARDRGGQRGEHDVLTGLEDVYGGRGNDVLAGDDGPNDLWDGDPYLSLRGNTGTDRFRARGGADYVGSWGGRDVLDLGPGGDQGACRRSARQECRIAGGPGGDLLWGSAGGDRLAGGPGDDELVGRRGADRLAGGTGRDRIDARDRRRDRVDGGAGRDRARVDRGRDAVRRVERLF